MSIFDGWAAQYFYFSTPVTTPPLLKIGNNHIAEDNKKREHVFFRKS